MTIQEFLNKYADLSKSDAIVYMEDAEGNVFHSIDEAHKKGTHPFVTKNVKDTALADLGELGIHSKNEASKFIGLLQFIYGVEGKGDKPMSRGRRTYSDQEKANILKAWKKAEAEGKTKADFSKETGVTYQTLFKWIKEA
ncbi:MULTISPECIES: transposase [Cyclobacterium]|uniref:transposase n=1 Tax=Cyclobacterium TaxID=68288 RepID=UPI001391EA6B|nr:MULTISPECIES: transposase [Cyclobacterium]